MNFVQRAIRYLVRKPSKTILLTITFFVIGNLVILGLGVSQASDNAKILTRKKMRAIVTYETDLASYWNYADTLTDQDEYKAAMQNSPRISKDIAMNIMKDERVMAFNYLLTNSAYSVNFENVPLGNEDMQNRDGKETYTSDGSTVRNVMIYATLVPNMIEIHEGTYTVTEGRFLNQDDIDQEKNVCLITKEAAEQNNLRVGDSIQISFGSPEDRKTFRDAGFGSDVTILESEIVGIYDTKENVDVNSSDFRWMSPYESPKNRIIMPYPVYSAFVSSEVEVMAKAHPDWYRDSDLDEMKESRTSPSRVVYLLDDPLNVDRFVEDNKNKLEPYTILNANNDTFKKMARPLDTMSFFANIVVWIVVINAIVIISLVTALTLKTREYEIGVLLSIGVSKIKMVMQLFLELLIIAIIGFTLASISGSLAAGKVGDMVLDFQTNSDAQYEDSDNASMFQQSDSYFTQVTQEDIFSEYHVSVSPLLIGEIFLLGAGVVLIATVIPSMMIMRLNPKQILLS